MPEPGHTDLDTLLSMLYGNRAGRLSRAEIYEQLSAAPLSADLLSNVELLPEGDYSQDELVEVLRAARAAHSSLDPPEARESTEREPADGAA